MSEEFINRIHASNDAFARRDVEAMISLGMREDVEFQTVIAAMEGGQAGIYRGHDGVRRWMRELDETMEDLKAEITEVHDLGDGRYLLAGRFSGKGKESGASFDFPIAWVYLTDEVENLKRFEAHLDRAAALESVGLEEWPEA
jgi:ketosteroid isomerase-like protein